MRMVCLCFLLLAMPSLAFSNEPIVPIVAPTGLNQAKVSLGERLFFETQLSADGNISCASCHDLELGGMDGLRFPIGVYGKVGDMNTPTVFNAALNFKQFWDGRADSLEAQMDGPILRGREMGNTWKQVVSFLRDDPVYHELFQTIYNTAITPEHVRDAMAEFERSLTLEGSRFDQYLQGKLQAISAEEKAGYKLFKSYGCVACHQGAGVGGNMFQKLGVMKAYFTQEKGIEPHDLGRFNVTQNPKDKFVFKVPSLRMVVLTAPYFHDGSVATLFEAIKLMGRHQLGREIPDDDVKLIEVFLHTLPGLYQDKAW
ncbi:MAG: cytochrome c peroxidase [Ghiorsea sp.]|nr:cytochrome c peroxidase [Ghiorsea sp.]